MTHPEELLAGYVDGTLEDSERAVVDAHLPGCATCREELDLAREAVVALASLPEEPVPFGVTGPVLAEAGRRFERRRAVVWQRFQWAAGAAAAAALVLVAVISLNGPSEDGVRSSADDGAAGGQAEGAPEASAGLMAAVQLESQPGVNYTDEGVRALAREFADVSAEELAPDAGADQTRETRDPARAIECLRSSGAPVDEPRDVLVRLIAAEYDNTPAYLAVFRENPGADQEADTIVVWIASIDGCTFIGGASQSL